MSATTARALRLPGPARRGGGGNSSSLNHSAGAVSHDRAAVPARLARSVEWEEPPGEKCGQHTGEGWEEEGPGEPEGTAILRRPLHQAQRRKLQSAISRQEIWGSSPNRFTSTIPLCVGDSD